MVQVVKLDKLVRESLSTRLIVLFYDISSTLKKDHCIIIFYSTNVLVMAYLTKRIVRVPNFVWMIIIYGSQQIPADQIRTPQEKIKLATFFDYGQEEEHQNT